MAAAKQREIVIEFEKVQTIRKRAKTSLAECENCGATRDVVSLADAAKLFETPSDSLLNFIRENDCHYHENENSNVFLCVASLIERMQQIHSIRRLKA